MRKSDISRRIADQTGFKQIKADDVVDVILQEIKQTLSRGESVILRRFGTFEVYAKNARDGRNPKTGEPAEIAARNIVRFKPGKPFKDAVNNLLLVETNKS
ncbi:MAG: hypothetical protein ETSY1_09110 [Candidatus Entotheonella factor]|uniref:Integration host factor subunit alpha n=1 Tax=Entotheonella factor TaxID=1429438 RepID=W4LSQ0_ENTF1|nr:MAG: hypothetical protein ETSY1_09110 [Candidatus Entotheonella factor]